MVQEQLHHSFNQIPLQPDVRRWWPKALAICALLGGICGASMGSAVGAVPGAVEVIEIAAGVLAVICSVPAARIGSLIGILTRTRFGSLVLVLFAAIAGALVGGLLATMILLALGAILGAVGGWLLARGIIALRHGILRRFLFGIAGAGLGMFLGAILWAVNFNPSAALAGAAWGLGIGLLVGPLLLVMIVGALNGLVDIHVSQRRNAIDAAFQREDETRRPPC